MKRARLGSCIGAAMVSAGLLAACASQSAPGRLPERGEHAIVRHREVAPTLRQRVERALGELSAGRVEAAEVEVRRALAEAPEDIGALVALARILKKGGDDAAALRVMRHVHAELQAEAGGRRFGADTGRARAELHAIAEELAAWLKAAATEALAQGRGWEAELLLAEHVEVKGSRLDPEVAATLSEMLLGAGLTGPGCAAAKTAGDAAASATRGFCAVIDANPKAGSSNDFAAAAGGRPEGWLRVGRFLLASGRTGPANEAFAKVAAGDGESPAIHGAVAMAAWAAGDEKLAIERIEAAIKASDDKRRVFAEAMVILGDGANGGAGAWQLGEKALRGGFGNAISALDATAMLARAGFAARDEVRLGALLADAVGSAQVDAIADFLHDIKAAGALGEWLRIAETADRKADADVLRVPTALALLKLGKTREAGVIAAPVTAGGGTGAEALRRAGLLGAVGRNSDVAAWSGTARAVLEASTHEQRLQLQSLPGSVAERLAVAEAVARLGDRAAALVLARAAFGSVDRKAATRDALLDVHLFLATLASDEGATPRDGEIAHHFEAIRRIINENPTAPGTLAIAVRIERLLTEPRLQRAPPATVARAARVPVAIISADDDPVIAAQRILLATSCLAETQLPRLAERLIAAPDKLPTVLDELDARTTVFPRRSPLHTSAFGAWLLAERIVKAGGDPCPIWLRLHPSVADSVERLLALGAGPVCHPDATRATVAELVARAARDPATFGSRILEAANFALQRGFNDAALALAKAQPNPTASHRDTALRALIRLGRRDEAVAMVLEKADTKTTRRPLSAFDIVKVFSEEGALDTATELATALLEKQGRIEHVLAGEIFELARKREDRDAMIAFAESHVTPDARVDGAALEGLGRRLGDIGAADVAARLIATARATRSRDLQLSRVAFRLAVQLRQAEDIERIFGELVDEPRATPANLLVSARDARQALIPGLAGRLGERLAKRFPTATEAAVLQIQAALDEGRVDDAIVRASAVLAADNWSRAIVAEVEPVFTDAARPGAWARVLAPALAEGRPRGDIALAMARALVASGQPEAAQARLIGLVNEVDAALPIAADIFRTAGFHDAAVADPVRALQVGPDGDAFAFFGRSAASMAAAGRADLFPALLDALGVAQPDITHDQRAELADHAANVGHVAIADSLRKSTATAEPRARAMLAIVRNCNQRGDDACALAAWVEHVEARLGAPQHQGRGDLALTAALHQTLRRIALETATSRNLAPRLVAAFAHRFNDKTPRHALGALAALMAGAAPSTAVRAETLPALPAGGRLSLELIPVYQDITSLCLARHDGLAAMSVQRWLRSVAIDRDLRLSAFKAALRVGFTDFALELADELLAVSPTANAGLLVEQAALEGLPGFALGLAERTLVAGAPSPIAQRAMSVLSATLGLDGSGSAGLTPGITTENRFEQRLFDIATAFAAGNHDAVLRLSEPLWPYAGLEARIGEMIVRSASVKADARIFARYLDAAARRPTPHAVALADVLAVAERVQAPREALAVLERLVDALPAHGPFIERALRHALATGNPAIIDAWTKRAAAAALEPGMADDLAAMLATAGYAALAASLIPNAAADTFAFWRARVHIAAANGDWVAWRSLATTAKAWDALAVSFTTNELLASAIISGTPEARTAGLEVAADFARRFPDRNPRAILDQSLRLAVAAGDIDVFGASELRRAKSWPTEALPDDVIIGLICRAGSANPWRDAAFAAFSTLAAMPEPERIDRFDSILVGTLEFNGDSCRVSSGFARAQTVSTSVIALAEAFAELIAPAEIAAHDATQAALKLRLLGFFGIETSAFAHETAFRLGAHHTIRIDLAEALVTTAPAEAAAMARKLIATPLDSTLHHITGLADFPLVRARAFGVLGRIAESSDLATAQTWFARARAALPDTAIAERARNSLDLARVATASGDAGMARGRSWICRTLLPLAPACRIDR